MTTQFGKLLRESLGLPATATEAEVRAAQAQRGHSDVCDAVGCHCAETLAHGMPGLAADVPLAMIVAPEFALSACPGGVCDVDPKKRGRCTPDVLGAAAKACCNEPASKK